MPGLIGATPSLRGIGNPGAWGFDVVKRVNSPRVKILYDIWHAQLMDGDIVRTIRSNIGR